MRDGNRITLKYLQLYNCGTNGLAIIHSLEHQKDHRIDLFILQTQKSKWIPLWRSVESTFTEMMGYMDVPARIMKIDPK